MIFHKIFVIAALVFLLAGCAGMTRTEQNVIGGGVLGAGLGAAIGAATGNPATGAAIGGAAGVVGGALLDSYERSNAGYYGPGYPAQPPPPPPGYYAPSPGYYAPPPPPPYPY